MKREFIIRNLKDVVNAYTAQINQNGKMIDIGGRRGMTLELEMIKAVLAAPTSIVNDKQKAEMILVGGHQRRLQCHQAKNAKDRLINTLHSAKLWLNVYHGKSFEDLYDEIDNLFKTNACTYAGQITKYDIAKRIGAFVNCLPIDYVYLHSGALIGAQRLFGNIKLKEGKYPVRMFANYFPSLNAMEIEDILCVFHNIYYNGGITIRYYFDDRTTINCHIFWPQIKTKKAVNKLLKNNNLPIIP